MSATKLEQIDTVRSDNLGRLAATLDARRPVSSVPAFWHWTSFLDDTPSRNLGLDGHPRIGGFIAQPPHPRRMFAGGRFRLREAMPIDRPILRRTSVGDIVSKQGRDGPLAFVTITHTYIIDGVPIAEEEQDLVYRPDPRERVAAGRPNTAAEPMVPSSTPDAALRRIRRFDERHLFRFSALTFNSHRIHYDHPYVTKTEGYPNLVVHGPLLVISLLDVVREELGDAAVTEVDFRAIAPAFVHEDLELVAQGETGSTEMRLEARRDGQILMVASIKLGNALP